MHNPGRAMEQVEQIVQMELGQLHYEMNTCSIAVYLLELLYGSAP
jgi:hypothetical protein